MKRRMLVCVGTNNKWISRLIRSAIRSKHSHAWLEFYRGAYSYVIHAQPKGIVIEQRSEVYERYPTMQRFEVVLSAKQKIIDAEHYAHSLLGVAYDYGVISNGLKLWWWYKTGRISKPYVDPVRLHCSEFVCLVLRKLGVTNWEQLNPELTHPGKLYNFMKGNSYFRYCPSIPILTKGEVSVP